MLLQASLTWVQVLVAYTALVTTIVGGILAFLFYQYFPLKSKVQQIYKDLYGSDGRPGLFSNVDDKHESLDERLDRIDEEHESLSDDIAEIRYYLKRIVEQLEENTDVTGLPDVKQEGKWRGDDD